MVKKDLAINVYKTFFRSCSIFKKYDIHYLGNNFVLQDVNKGNVLEVSNISFSKRDPLSSFSNKALIIPIRTNREYWNNYKSIGTCFSKSLNGYNIIYEENGEAYQFLHGNVFDFQGNPLILHTVSIYYSDNPDVINVMNYKTYINSILYNSKTKLASFVNNTLIPSLLSDAVSEYSDNNRFSVEIGDTIQNFILTQRKLNPDEIINDVSMINFLKTYE